MNNSTNGRPVWNVLAAKAQKELRQAQLTLADMHQRKQQAVERDEKLEQLLVEYALQLTEVQQRAHSTSEAGNYRQFINQLQDIKIRAKNEIQALENDCKDARQTLVAADCERLKLESLAQRAEDKQNQQLASQEAKRAEAENIIQYNLREMLRRQ
ncbi:flagellar FliJ family protein [Porticoccaceae bacterium]|jgi:flagellar export protein FliJ|nr:flagellar FliJ family protein [Porticoccaceae bacterium]